MSIFWLLVSCFIIGISKAAQDTIRHHFEKSVFNVKNKWLNKWFKSEWQDWPLYLGLFRFDAWHVFGWIHYLGISLLLGTGVYFGRFNWTISIIILPIIFFFFETFYRYGFIKVE